MFGNLFKKGASRLGADLEKLMSKIETVSQAATGEAEATPKSLADGSSSFTKVLLDKPGGLGEFYFPSELIGGCCPRVAGQEEEIVWNAAAEACDTERVHVVWQSTENRIWYLAVRSSEIASHTNTWCPFASLLPDMKDARSVPVCYTYFSDEAATMMTLTAEGLQIHRGMSSVVRAKAERSARELGDAPVIELVPDRILKLTPVPWYSVSLFEDRARRILATVAVMTAIGLAVLSFAVWLLTTMVIVGAKVNLHEAQARASSKTTELMQTVSVLRSSPVRDQLSKFSDLNDGLLTLNGFLEVYEINKEGQVRWRAIVPTNVTADRINQIGGKTIETTPAGVAVGNAEEIAFEAAGGRSK